MSENMDREKALNLMKSTIDKRMFERYQSIYLLLSNMKIDEVAKIVGRSPRTIKNYKRLYHTLGLEGLSMGKSTGRPNRLTEEQLQQLKDLILTKLPVDVDFSNEFNWTAGIIAKWIKKEYDIEYTISGTVNLLKTLGLSYTRPTYTLAKADLKKQEEFKKTFQGLKKDY